MGIIIMTGATAVQLWFTYSYFSDLEGQILGKAVLRQSPHPFEAIGQVLISHQNALLDLLTKIPFQILFFGRVYHPRFSPIWADLKTPQQAFLTLQARRSQAHYRLSEEWELVHKVSS